MGEIATETYGGGTPKTSNEEFWKGDIPWIQSSDLIDECLFDVRPRKCISQEAVSKSATKLVPQNSIAIVTRVGVGKLAFMPFSYATSQDFLSLSGLKIDPEFTVYALYKMTQSVSNEVQGTSIKGVTKDELLAKKIIFPSCNEQKKIGAYLHNLDHLITLHQRKRLGWLKVGKNDWEQRKLGEVFRERIERAAGDEELLSVTIANGVIRQADSEKRNIASEDKKNYKVVHQGDVPYNSMRMWQGAVGNSEYCGIVSPAYTVLIPTQEANGKFFMELFKKENSLKIFQRWSQGLTSDTWNLKYPVLSTIEFYIPKIDEQNKIATYFTTLDHLITLHQRKRLGWLKVGKNDWEQRKLGELGSLKNGMNFSKEAMGIGFPFVNLQNIFGNNVIDVSNLGKAMASDSQLKDYNLLNGDVLFVRSSVKLEGVGEAALVPQTLDNTTYSGFIIRFRDEYGLDNNFKRFVFGIESVRNQIMSQATNSANKNISQSVLENLELAIPSKSEQQKIGAYFSNLDHLITLHQRKRLGWLKVGKNDWEQRKLGEIGSVSMCRRIFKEQTSETGDIPFYKIGTFGADPDAFISRELFEEYKSKYPYPQKGDILISASGSIGRTVEFAGNNEYFQDSNIVWLNHDERLSNPFLKCFYSVVKWAGIEGSTIKRLYNDNILNTVICMPSVPEQKRIGLFFENLDNLITLHQQK